MDEHTLKMKEISPKYPCAACQRYYTKRCPKDGCPKWLKWFKDEWDKLRKSLGANVEK